MDWGGGASNPFALFVEMKMRRNEHTGGSDMPRGGKNSNAFGGLRQFSAELVYLGTCLGRIGLGGGDVALLFFRNGLSLTSCNDDLFFFN
jgi:hypothetical protein